MLEQLNGSRSLSSLLTKAVDHFPQRPFLIGTTVYTYEQAAQCVEQLAAWLYDKQVQRGDRVMCIAVNCPEVLLLCLAASRIGAIFTVLHPSIKAASLKKIVMQCSPSVVLLDETTTTLTTLVRDAHIIWRGTSRSTPDDTTIETILGEYERYTAPFDGIDLDPACLIYTSGSTSEPRGVLLSHDNILFAIAAIQQRLMYQATDIIGLFLPLAFDYGLYQVFLALQSGAALFVGRPEMVTPELVKILARENISILPGVPSLFAALIKLLQRHGHLLPQLRCVTNTGDHFPEAYIEQLHRLLPRVQIFPMYGLTECKRVSILTPSEWADHPGSVGLPLDGTEVYVIDANGTKQVRDAQGELVVRGRHVALGYWKAPEETQQRFRHNISIGSRELYTHDICRLDQDGYIYYVGRADDLLKHNGYRLNPREIEEAALDIPYVTEAGVVKVMEREALFLFLTTTAPLSEATIREELQKRLEAYKLPNAIVILPQLPHTTNGKLDRKQLHQTAREMSNAFTRL